VRNVRRSANDSLRKAQKSSAISEDELRRAEDELQTLTDAHTAMIDGEASRKEADLLEI
jgi:ribosome recycling factor